MAFQTLDDINTQLSTGGSASHVERDLVQDIVDSFVHHDDASEGGASVDILLADYEIIDASVIASASGSTATKTFTLNNSIYSTFLFVVENTLLFTDIDLGGETSLSIDFNELYNLSIFDNIGTVPSALTYIALPITIKTITEYSFITGVLGGMYVTTYEDTGEPISIEELSGSISDYLVGFSGTKSFSVNLEDDLGALSTAFVTGGTGSITVTLYGKLR